jgi:hypothetical protein
VILFTWIDGLGVAQNATDDAGDYRTAADSLPVCLYNAYSGISVLALAGEVSYSSVSKQAVRVILGSHVGECEGGTALWDIANQPASESCESARRPLLG